VDKHLREFLDTCDRAMWGMSHSDKARALKDLERHIKSKAEYIHSDEAVKLVVSVMGDPKSIAKGLRMLYGYSWEWKMMFFSVATFMSLVSIPLFGVWAVMIVPVIFLWVVGTGQLVGKKTGLVIGLGAGLTRIIAAFCMVAVDPAAFTIGPVSAVMDFLSLSVFMTITGVLAGDIRDKSLEEIATDILE
jgi:hypothetical protein